jgi:DNA-binding response OmpR family regulator
MRAVARVLVVEDDPAIAVPLARALAREGYEVASADSIAAASRELAGGDGAEQRAPVDVVVLDRGLPDGDGLEVVRRARRTGSTLPFLVLTARAEEVDLVIGLDAGADDHLTKPFRLPELLARLRALLRRAAPEAGPVAHDPLGERSVLAARGVVLDQGSRQVWKDGAELRLSAKEFDLLRALLREAGTVVAREELMSRVWGADWFGSTKTLDMHVSWLRRKLGDPVPPGDGPQLITTVRGVGFRFERD